MANTDQPAVVSDAGPIIHLDELACLDLLDDFAPVLVPAQVWAEVVVHRAHLASAPVASLSVVDSISPLSPRLLTLADSLGLDAGERAALALAQERSARLLLCDDAAARLAGESLGFEVHGTIGLLLRSIRRGTRTREQILSLLRDLPRISTLHIARKLLATVLASVEHYQPDH
jgi:predicted nucleic acid-binding protein